MTSIIPYGRQYIDKSDSRMVYKSLKESLITTGNFVKKFENKLSNFLKVKNAISCNSGTSALHLAFLASDIKKNDIVIMPAINFISAYSMCKKLGAKIYLADVNSIRNLADISQKLQKGGLEIPGNLRVLGTLQVDKTVGIRRAPHPKVGLLVNGQRLSWAFETEKGRVKHAGRMKVYSLLAQDDVYAKGRFVGQRCGAYSTTKCSGWSNSFPHHRGSHGDRRIIWKNQNDQWKFDHYAKMHE